jgi:hypothetical protein
MRALLQIVGVIAAVVVAYYAYDRLFPDDNHRIRTVLDDLAATVSHTGGDGLSQLTQAAKLGRFFTQDVVIDLGSGFSPIRGRDTVMALAAKAQIPGEGFHVRFVDVTVSVDPSGVRAVAGMTATVQGRSLSDLQAIDAKELEMELQKVDGEWRIDRVIGVEAIQRPR